MLNIYKTPRFTPEAIVSSPPSNELSAAALHVAHCEKTLNTLFNKMKIIKMNFFDITLKI